MNHNATLRLRFMWLLGAFLLWPTFLVGQQTEPRDTAEGAARDESQEIGDFFLAVFETSDDGDRIGEVAIHPGRMLEIIVGEHLLPTMDEGERQAIETLLESSSRRDWVRQSIAGDWHHAEVLLVRPLKNSNDHEAVVRMCTPAGDTSQRLLFHMTPGDNPRQWRIADWQLADSTLSVAVQKGVLLAAMQGDFDTQDLLSRLQGAFAAVGMNDDPSAARLLRIPLKANAPPSLQTARWLLMADMFTRQGRFDLAATCLDEVERLAPEMPILWRLRAAASLAEEDYESALSHARRALELGGIEPDALTDLGIAQRGLQETESAITAFSDALRAERNQTSALFELAQTLPEERMPELKAPFLRLADPEREMPPLAEELLAAGNGRAVEVLVTALAELVPNHSESHIYLGEAKLLLEDHAGAAEQFAAALRLRTEEDDRSYLEQRYATAMVKAGKADEAFALLAGNEPEEALILLSTMLLNAEEDAALEKLLFAAEESSPAYVAYARGKLALRHNDYSAAAEHLSTAMSRMPVDGSRRQAAEDSYLFAQYQLGQAMSGYDKARNKPAAFEQLAELAAAAHDADTLIQLLEAFREQYPDDRRILLWEAELLWQREDYSACQAFLEENREAILADDTSLARYEDRLVRSLLRTEQLDEALDLAVASTQRDGDPWFEMVVRGVAGDVRDTAQLVEECLAIGYTLVDIYDDSDLSVALLAEPFTELRSRFPQPDSETSDE